jgi:hypothetical protein
MRGKFNSKARVNERTRTRGTIKTTKYKVLTMHFKKKLILQEITVVFQADKFGVSPVD